MSDDGDPGREVNTAFAANVARVRAAQGLGLRDLARACGCSQSVIHRIEHGQVAQLPYAVAIAHALGVTLGSLLDGGPCLTCFGRPPAGFSCLSCGARP